MNDDHTLMSFILGAAIGGAAAYYLLKHQDEIAEKIREIEEGLNLEENELIEQAKSKFDALGETIRSTFQSSSLNDSKPSSEELSSIMDELARLREEVRTLTASKEA
ncbi:hypothetical protein E0765_09565 [Sulfuricurvum sp. IAE1]|jgi:hypothetical protein|uniref:hypothetical protein n=1 Tax=Sulfuricurvum sp. IAE1 TaxID=2546102 RepID=UPI001053DB54|nr:hypothetical protein [Sulfuricurvum sp. IAE1]MDD3770514.1 hypothetical protein [Sulfuricurvum sp.]MDX9965898.1 hypothetical protein [Sulfuricurvum sp.]TDA62826.1 hypothetical protein E0765_09565 [Sulfuricurvum sp. IAE1]